MSVTILVTTKHHDGNHERKHILDFRQDAVSGNRG